MSSWRSSSWTRAWRAPAASRRAWDRTSPRLRGLLLGLLQLLLQPGQGVVGVLDLVQLLPAPVQVGQHVLHRGAVLLPQPVEQVQPAPPPGPCSSGEKSSCSRRSRSLLQRRHRRRSAAGRADRRSGLHRAPWSLSWGTHRAACGHGVRRRGRCRLHGPLGLSGPGQGELRLLQGGDRACRRCAACSFWRASSSSSPGFSSARSSSLIW